MTLKSLLTFVIGISLIVRGYAAVGPPDLRCLFVNATGNVILNWIAPADPAGEFIEYRIHMSNNLAGPYTQDVLTGLTTNTFTKTTNALLNSKYFFIETVYNDGSGGQATSSSDTLATMLIQLSAQSDTSATLKWNKIRTPKLATHSNTYKVFRRFGTTGAWTQIGTRLYGNEKYVDTFKVCSQTIQYKVEVDDASGCTNVSAVAEDLFEDILAPDPPVIDYITVDTATGDIIVYWKPSKAKDTDGYIITYMDFGSVPPVYINRDTVKGINSITYRDTIANGNISFQQYGVAAFDTCVKGTNANTSSIHIEHRSVFLQAAQDNCEKKNNLKWTHYLGWPTDLGGYEVYVEIDGGTSQMLGSVNDTDSVYVHENIDPEKKYCYYVLAVSKDKSKKSSSNKYCINQTNVISPKVHYINKVSVVNNSYVNISCYVDTTLTIDHYSLERAIRKDGPFLKIASLTPTGDSIISFNDNSLDFRQASLFYRVGIVDSCGVNLFYSDVSNSIYLNGKFDEFKYHNSLKWTNYKNWDISGSSVEKYNVYRFFNGTIQTTPAFSVPSSQLNLIDSLVAEHMTSGKEMCFVVEAVESSGNKYGFQEKSFSNEFCFTSNPIIWIPNAFVPDGVNNEFKPVISFGDWSNYRLEIFDRYGQLVFQSSDQNDGWRGNIGGKPANMGNYVYRITIGNYKGDSIFKTGVLTLVR